MSKVLLVDDEPSIRFTLAEFLKRAGYDVLTAADYESAHDLLNEATIDVAIFDINLPRQSGIELLVETQRRESYIPVIMITGDPNLAQVPELVRAGAYDFIVKPVVKDVILSAVARALEKKRLNDEKRRLEAEVKAYAEELENRVAERTAELAQAHSFLSLVLESSTEYAIVVIDGENRLTLFNRGAELIFGYTAEQAKRLTLKDLFAGEDDGEQSFLKCIQIAHQSGRCQTEVQLRRADASLFPAFIAITPIHRLDNTQFEHLYIIRDLTAERQNEKALREMQARLAHHEKIAELGRVAAQVAHEIKNPLAGLLLYSMHLKNRAAGKLDDRDFSLVNKIVDTINHLKNTTEQIVNFARPISLSPHRIDLNIMVTEVLHLLQPQITSHEVEMNLQLDPAGIFGMLDAASLRASLMNLILNAVQAMPDGGTLSVHTEKAPSTIRLIIADTGSGMTEEQLRRVFEPFYTTKNQGLGLGMPYTQKVIEQHRGTIKIDSRPNEGTRITLELPAATEGEAKLANAAQANSGR